MSIVVSTWVDPRALPKKLSSGPEPPEVVEKASPDNFSRVTAAFATLYTRYESALARSLDVSNLDDPKINRSSVPEITVGIVQEQTTTVVFDADLLALLVQIYALHGWNGIFRVESALGERWTEADTSSAAGGTTLSVWATVVPFFKATRNLVASLVRDALADIEQQARSRIESRLKAADKALDKAWTSDLRMTVVGKTIFVESPEKGRVPVVTKFFAFGDRALADDVFVELTHAVKAKTALEKELKRVRGEADQLAARQSEYERTKQNKDAPGNRSPYAEDATPENVKQKIDQQRTNAPSALPLLPPVNETTKRDWPSRFAVSHDLEGYCS